MTLMLLDSASLWYRAYYGMPDTLLAPDGTPVNAIRGYLDMTARLVGIYKPNRLVACLDGDWRPSWRVDIFPAYKANRLEEEGEEEVEPETLTPQIPILLDILDLFGFPVVGVDDYEADDVMATYAEVEKGPIRIVTGDRDLFQMVDDKRDIKIVYLANMSAFYAMWHGPAGLRAIAQRVHDYASRLQIASKSRNDNVFDTVTVDVKDAALIHRAANSRDINFAPVSSTQVRISFDEATTEETFADVLAILGLSEAEPKAIPTEFSRTSSYLTHPVFNTNHSETGMMRYLRNLADRDLALDRTMIPLGSCTMKLNSVTEMEAVAWPEFSSLHPFAPADQNQGSRKLIKQLSDWLVAITGYDAVSLQPNAGSQGEFAGLLAIRNYHDSRGDQARNICLIPSSAHGTNAASAVMAGMKVIVVECDENGNVSVADLKSKIAANADSLAALMITYPSTHGVFETAVSEICALVHDAGGQVYVDGANLNALVGVAQPGKFGADVSHLNLHKTFAIPHGGGGPGVGPVISRAHLAPFLPNHPLDPQAGPATGPGPISAAPFGSASILPISWAYIRLLGGVGLTHSTQVAILSANYMAAQLAPSYPVLYTGANGRVAHECILDIRELTKLSGVTVDDIAKRLMDFGFHAPTMSFPVAGTLMIEPTESEDMAEISRFIAAMVAIRAEIQEIIDGKIAVADSALHNAPHTALTVTASAWDRAYSREKGGYPAPLDGFIAGEIIGSRMKYWPPVSRIDGAYGDRNLVCACPPISDFQE